ncbi:MAG: hypothetical protein CFE37_02455 [Alphaproteobacteria bacterium PA4]|nr:MAG: hypothetical protein CFE37_02455 [Alphaproteobacteria bacterium PA4]
MRSETVEIFSDQTNAAILRHPDRKFPGVLVQGDSLYQMCQQADAACKEVGRGQPGFDVLNDLRNALWLYLTHYKVTFLDNGFALPFSEQQAP